MNMAFRCLLLLLLTATACVAADVVLADFEEGSYGDWIVEGDAFGDAPAGGTLSGQQDVSGFRGSGLVNTFRNQDKGTGTLTSPEFSIQDKYLCFLIGGGQHPGEVGIELLVNGRAVRAATGNNSEMLSWTTWDVGDLLGQEVQLRIFDRHVGGFGHINVDQIVQTSAPRKGPGVLRLSDYRKTDDYYNELYRPQFHFTPPINWMNDPNGLVYFDGEYHLFYQHNPHGNAWGHMSWGHAVSEDMLHWRHLPIALHEEYGVMVFSGCAVIDWKNTSGFGRDGKPPMVAIYTGHGLGKQTQDLAYSNDRGRTWTKYEGNPVIDLNEADFRDPKVFWHEPTSKWVMVVSMATAKYVQFYGSKDLKTWEHLSNFGPAGVRDKPNWECPDLFELPIEGEPGKTRWVLEVDMGNGSIAGGSGGEYFVGTFDGVTFQCDHDIGKSQWVDFGRDFYAPVSWSDIPESDGRRIWLSWMNNWETNLVPTSPWRSAMSIPRTLSLRRTPAGLKLIQKPIRELQSLRTGDPVELSNVTISEADQPLGSQGISGNLLELIATFEVGDATEFGFRLCKGTRGGKQESTVVGYDAQAGELFVDRTNSGKTDFHPAFAGRHAGPLPAVDGEVAMHIFVDTSSVEVFGGGGETNITDRIFPGPASTGVSLFSKGGTSKLKSLKAWKLQPSMRR